MRAGLSLRAGSIIMTIIINKAVQKRQVTVRVSQGLPLSMAVIGRTSAEVNFLQHHIALGSTIKYPTPSTYQNHRNSLQITDET